MDTQQAVQTFGSMLTALEGITVLAKPRVSREVKLYLLCKLINLNK